MPDNREFLVQLYEFLKENEVNERYADAPMEDCIAELEEYLSDIDNVKDTIKDIKEIAEAFDDDDVYSHEIKPIISGLTDIRNRLEYEQNRRMVSNTGYEVKHSMHIGDREIVVAENMNAPDGEYYFIADYRENGIMAEYSRCQVSNDYMEIMKEYTTRLDRQIDALNAEIGATDFQAEIFTPEQCYPNDYKQDITGEVVAIKTDALRPEYRRGDTQLVCVTHGNGARANPRGTGVYCFHLSDGKQTRFERHDIQGKVKELPVWAKERLEIIQAEREAKKLPASEKVGNYTITERVEVGKTLFVLGENPKAPSPFATWQRSEGRTGYDIGHYHQTRDGAVKDLHDRANNERETQESGKSRKAKERGDAR